MITFGKAHAIGTGKVISGASSVIRDGKEVGRIYFMPLSFNHGFPYNLVMDGVDRGFFSSEELARENCETGRQEGKRYWK